MSKDVLDVENCCRICRCCRKEPMDNIFDYRYSSQGKTIAEILSQCLRIKLLRGEALPELICGNCSNSAQNLYTFRNLVAEAERLLLRLKSQKNIEVNNEILQQFEVVNDLQNPVTLQLSYNENIDVLSDEDDEDVKPLSHFLVKIKEEEHDIDSTQEHDILENSEIMGICRTKIKRTNKKSTQIKLKAISDGSTSEHQCELCQKTFRRSYGLSRHMLSHVAESQFTCPHCPKSFKRNDHLRMHQARMHDTRPYKCNECNKTYVDEKELNSHKQQRHISNNEKLFTCEHCLQNFRHELRLRRHINDQHNAMRSYNCKGCVRQFPTKSECDAHMKEEKHYKTHMCPECGKCFGSTNNLHVHVQRHRGAKPFKCKYCEKGFLRRADVKIHERYHTNEQCVFCEECGRGFQRRNTLVIHMRTHTGEKPYKCPHCEQAFTQSQDLKAHIRRHTGNLLRCELCDAGFSQAYALRQHKLVEHNIREEPLIKRLVKIHETINDKK